MAKRKAGSLDAWLGRTKSTDQDTGESSKSSGGTQESGARKVSKHSTSFNDSWMVGRESWLVNSEKGMFCKLCQKHNSHGKKGTWTKVPCVRLREEALKEHSTSSPHQNAEVAESEMKFVAARKGDINTCLKGVVSAQEEAVICAMKCLYWITKEELPFTTKLESLKSFAVDHLGCVALKNLNLSKNANYTSDQIKQEFLESMATPLLQDIKRSVSNSPVFGLICDESMDISVKSQLVTEVRYIDGNGKCKTSFLEFQDLPNGKADTITAALTDLCQRCDFNLSKLTSFGSDGASVMVGKHNGVAARLRALCPQLVNIHCIAHRTALAAAQAADAIPAMKKFKNYLSQLYYFYESSPVRMSGLKEIETILNLPEIKLKQASDVRWLSHQRAVEAIKSALPAVVMSLSREGSERDNATAVGLHRYVATYEFLAIAHMLYIVLPHLNRLSKVFQSANVNFGVIRPMVEGTKSTLRDIATSPQIILDGVRKDILERLHTIPEFEFLLDKTVIKDKALSFTNTIFKPYMEAIQVNLTERFPAIELFEAFSIFDPSTHPHNNDSQELIKLATQFTMLDKEELIREWAVAKTVLEGESKDFTTKGTMELFASDKYRTIFPNIATLAAIGLVIPVSTADCERAFSTLKRIKTRLRNRLAQKTLNNLAIISIEGPSIDGYDFARAMRLWGAQSQRRIFNS